MVSEAGDRPLEVGQLLTEDAYREERQKYGQSFDAEQLDALSTLAGLASVSLRNADLRDEQRNFFAHVTEILVGALDRAFQRAGEVMAAKLPEATHRLVPDAGHVLNLDRPAEFASAVTEFLASV